MQKHLYIWLVLFLAACTSENSFQGFHIYDSETGAKDICLVDIDNDEDLDIVGVNFYSVGIFTLENLDGINFEKTTSLQTSWLN